MIEVGAPKYSRVMPPEWPGLLEVAQSHLGQQTQPSRETAVSMLDDLDSLGDEALSINKYYGLGLAMCSLATQLRVPAMRDQVVEDAALYVSAHILEVTKGDRTNVEIARHVHEAELTRAFLPFSLYSASSLKPDVRLTSDALVGVAERREKQHILEQFPEEAQAGSYIIDSAEEGTATAQVLASNILGGASLVMRRVFDLVGMEVEDDQEEHENVDEPAVSRLTTEKLQQILDDEEFGFERGLNKVMLRSAGLRIDEVNDLSLMSRLIAINDQGKLDFTRANLPKQPPSLPAYSHKARDVAHRVLHGQRLSCPAVHVEGMIPLAIGLMTEILDLTATVVRPSFSGRVTL